MDQILSLIEVVMGAAVMCDEKAQFIARIFALDHDSQTVLKGMIERVMTRVTNLDSDEYDQDYNNNNNTLSGRNNNNNNNNNVGNEGNNNLTFDGDMSEDLLRSQELVRHLQEERQRLLKEVSSLESNQNKLKTELDTTKSAYQTLQLQLTDLNRNNDTSGNKQVR